MAKKKEKEDLHFPNIGLIILFYVLFGKTRQFNIYVEPGQTVADIGCGPGIYTLPLAKHVGKDGKVYAVDSNYKSIKVLKKRAARKDLNNIIAINASAVNIDMIKDESIDFILANGLLCSVAPQNCSKVVSEIKRILKPSGRAYLMASSPPFGYMKADIWESILSGFNIVSREHKNDFIAIVTKKPLE